MPWKTGASAAHTIKGAIKAGKAIPGAAKGAAAGGPYGAVAGAVWAGRKHIGKIIAVIIILLLLPVLFVLMLPGLIFGGLVNAFSPADSEAPVLNSETAIVENANDITFTINSILGEALDDVMARIEEDFASSGVDHMEIKIPIPPALFSMPISSSLSIVRPGMRILKVFHWMIWPLFSGIIRNTCIPTPASRNPVRLLPRTRKPARKPPLPKHGSFTRSGITVNPILRTMFSHSRMSKRNLPLTTLPT